MSLYQRPPNELCIRGTIFTDNKCPICKSSYKYDDHRRGLFCPSHADQQATSRFLVQFGRKLRMRFSDFKNAERFLDGLRYEVDRGTFDYRDYLKSNPLSFITLSQNYLKKKKLVLKPGTYIRMFGMFGVAQKYFANTNVKYIQYAQLEDFIETLQVSNKTKSNYLSCLKDFFHWLLKRQEITSNELPQFPAISFELGFRKTIDKDTQSQILSEIKRISLHVNLKIWLGIKWLTTYISIRPSEMRNIKESHIDLKQGYLFIPHPKEKRPKIVPLIKEDLEILKNIPVGLPDLYFFRHQPGVSGCKPGQRFGVKCFYKWWKRACYNLGIEGVDLYGGTRHSSAIGLRSNHTPEQIRRATMHSTNKAFERYFQISREELQEMYQATQCDTVVIPKRKKTDVEKDR